MTTGIHHGIAYNCLDVEGRRDWLDGWHEECELAFVSKRDKDAMRPHLEIGGNTKQVRAELIMVAGRAARLQMREERETPEETDEAPDESPFSS